MSVIARLVFFALAAIALPASAHAEHLEPRNECRPLEGFEQFEMTLVTAVTNRDANLLSLVVHPQVHLDFGGGHGWAAMQERLISEPYNLWAELEAVLRLGCARFEDGHIAMPYYWAQEMPAGYDAYGSYIVLGEDVPMYAGEASDVVVGTLNWEAVEAIAFFEAVEDMEDAERWEIRTGKGQRGFVDRGLLRALVDYRLLASRDERGDWQITAFIAGD